MVKMLLIQELPINENAAIINFHNVFSALAD